MRSSPNAMKTMPIVPMIAMPIRVQRQIACRAMRALPAPMYWPASAPAAVPIAKPGRNENDSHCTVMMCAPTRPSLVEVPRPISAALPMKPSTSRFTVHMARPSKKFGTPTRMIRHAIGRSTASAAFSRRRSFTPWRSTRQVRYAPTRYDTELPAAMPNTPHWCGSSGDGLGSDAPKARIVTPEISHDAMQLTTLTQTAIWNGLCASPAPCRHMPPTIITPQKGMP